jgi:Fe-Mn family superoxide dismutase
MLRIVKKEVDPGMLAAAVPGFDARYAKVAAEYGPFLEACGASRAVFEPYLMLHYAGDEATAKLALEDVIRITAGDPRRVDIFHHAAHAWNHLFYWHSMRPDGGGVPPGTLGQQIAEAFCGFPAFKRALTTAAASLCGSGWVWLVVEQGTLKVTTTRDAETPLVYGQRPLLTIDVWEHAYDLDYQGRRADYITAFLEHLVHWDFVAANLAQA